MNWATIRSFGSVKYFNVSYGVLVGVPLLAGVYKVLRPAVSFTLPLELKLAYLASLCYSLAITTYQWFCPFIVKRYADVETYIEAQQTIVERAHPTKKAQIVLANLFLSEDAMRAKIQALIEKSETEQSIEERSRVLCEVSELVAPLYSACVQRFLDREYQDALKTYRWAIWLSGGLYIAGTLILVYLLVVKTWDVFSS